MIRSRGRGRWQVVIYAGRDPSTGRERRIRRTVHGTKTAARDIERAMTLTARRTSAAGATVTFAEAATAWLAHVTPDLSPRTVRGYRDALARHITPAIGDRPLGAITAAELDALYAARRAHLAPKSIANLHVIIRRAFTQAVRWGWVHANPARDATPPRVPTPDVHPPPPGDVAAVLDHAAATEPALGVFLWLAATTGARRGEICGLRWTDIDLDDGTVLIERAVIVVPGGVAVRDTKTHAARRITLGTNARAMLAEHFHHHGPPDPWVFTSPTDPARPWHPDTVTAAYRRAQVAAGVPHTRLHDLRHFMVTEGLAGGAPVRTVAGRAGHRNPAMTLNTYAHFVPATDAVLAEALEERIRSSGKSRQPG